MEGGGEGGKIATGGGAGEGERSRARVGADAKRASAANEPGALAVGGVGLGAALYHGGGENFCGAECGPFSSRNPEQARSRKFSG